MMWRNVKLKNVHLNVNYKCYVYSYIYDIDDNYPG